ncbi:MAG: ABC transporter permease [Candidatus Heimdallarchaeaceae archaeon]|jgi:ABC-type multidrug transport system permease subunit
MSDKKNQIKLGTIVKRVGYQFRTVGELGLKYIKETIRNRIFLLIAVLLPIFFMIFMALGFGAALAPVQTYNIYVLNIDLGYTNASITYDFGDLFMETLENATYPAEENEDLVSIYTVDEIESYNASIEQDLAEGNHDLVVIIYANFSEVLFNVNQDIFVTVRGDPTTANFQTAVSILGEIFDTFTTSVRSMFTSIQGQSSIKQEHTINIQEQTFFDQLVPGIVILAITMNLTFVATTLVEEQEFDTLERLQLTPMRGYHLIGGLIIAQLAVALVQIIILLALSLLFGFNGTGSFFLAGLVAWLLSLSASGIGLIVASFSNKGGVASGIGSMIAIPLFMLTGAFIPIPNPTIFSIGSNQFGVVDLLPTSFAYKMMDGILMHNLTFADLTFELVSLIILTIIYLGIGLLLVTLSKLRPKKE